MLYVKVYLWWRRSTCCRYGRWRFLYKIQIDVSCLWASFERLFYSKRQKGTQDWELGHVGKSICSPLSWRVHLLSGTRVKLDHQTQFPVRWSNWDGGGSSNVFSTISQVDEGYDLVWWGRCIGKEGQKAVTRRGSGFFTWEWSRAGFAQTSPLLSSPKSSGW